MGSKFLVALTASSVMLAGCSSKPRNFAPVLGAAPTDAKLYEAQWLSCREQVATSAKTGSERGASAVGGVAAGAGGAAVMGAATAGTYAGYAGAAAALGATFIAAPLALIGGAWGLSKIKKTKKERAIKTATADCLSKAGYAVQDWRVMKKQEVRSLPALPGDKLATHAHAEAQGSLAEFEKTKP